MDPISGVAPADLPARADPSQEAARGLGTSKSVTTRPDASVVTIVTDAEGRVVSRDVDSAQVSTVTTPDGVVLDRVMSPRGGVMYVDVTAFPPPEAEPDVAAPPPSVPDSDASGGSPKLLDVLA